MAKDIRGLRFERDPDFSGEPYKIFVDTIAMFRGAWVTVSKHYTQELEHVNLRGRVYGAFYTVTIKLVNGDLVNFVEQGKNPGTDGKPITFGVNANLWPMGKAPSCHAILEAWPAYPLSTTASSLI